MAVQGQKYIPELPKVFRGEDQILSWFELSERLLNHTTEQFDPILLEDEEWLSRLTAASPSLSSRKNDSTAFETQTAAISVSPANNAHYDLAEIKEDALWLSGELNLDSLEALRIILLEWQDRPHHYLRAGYSEVEIASLHGLYGSNLAFDAELQTTFFSLRSEDNFKTQTARRCRQIFTYFKESVSLVKTIVILSSDPIVVSRITAGKVTHLPLDGSLAPCADLLTGKIAAVVNGPQWSVIDDHTNYVWQAGHLQEIAMLMEFLINTCRAVSHVPSSILKKWMDALASVGFFAQLEPSPLLPADQVSRMHILATLTSLAIIDPANSIAEADALSGPSSTSWLRSADLIAEVQNILYDALAQSCIQAGPAAFAWALSLQKIREKAIESKDHRENPVSQRTVDNITTFDAATGRQGSLTTPTQTCFEDAIDAVRLTEIQDNDSISTILSLTLQSANVAEILAAMMTDTSVKLLPPTTAARSQILQEVIAATLMMIPDNYGPEILLPQFAVLEPQREASRKNYSDAFAACTTFLNDSLLVSNIFDVAASRFPHEAVPFLRMSRLLAGANAFDGATQYISYRLKDMEFFTHAKSGPLGSYRTVREDENLNLVELENNCYAFPTEMSYLQLTNQQHDDKALIIPAGAVGEIISDGEVPVVRWQYHYSGFAVIGEWLELHFNGVLHNVISSQESTVDIIAEVILLLAQLLETTSRAENVSFVIRNTAIDMIFDEASTNLSFGSNIVDLVFDILEQELQSYRRRPASPMDTSILHASIRFINVLLNARPADFWSRITKTSIAKSAGSASPLYALINGVEGISGTAQVTEAVAELYKTIVHTAVGRYSDTATHAQASQKASIKLLHNEDRVFEDMLYNITSTMVEIYDTLPTWKQLSLQQETLIISHLNESFLFIVYLSYGVGSTHSSLTGCYHRAAELLVSRLSPLSVNDAKAGALMQYLLPTTQTGDKFASDESTELRITSCIKLAIMILNVQELQGIQLTGLESCLFDLCPVLVRQLYTSTGQQFPTAQLLCALLRRVPQQKSASLLGQLGSMTCISMLNSLVTASLSRAYCGASMAWDVLTNLVSRHQQWLSMVVLTGAVPEKQPQNTKSNVSVYRGKLFIDQAVARVTQQELWCDTASTEQRNLACSILKFLSTAQQNWSWVLPSTKATTNMFRTLIDFITKQSGSTSLVIDSRNHANALLVDLGSVVLQHAKSVRDLTLMKTFLPLVNWLTQNAVDLSGYNASLHTNLSQNFLSKFNYDISNFKRTKLVVYGSSDFYDVEFANTILAGKSGWKLEGRYANQSYFTELIRANVNLTTVAFDVRLLQSFRNLCIEHAAFFAQDSTTRVTMAHIIQRCLTANTKTYPAEKLFDDLFQSRIEIALALINCVVEVKETKLDFRNLLIPAWQCLIYKNASYEVAVTNNDLHYWHTSICVVLLALQFHVGHGRKPLGSVALSSGELMKHTEPGVAEATEIASIVVGDGLSTITSILLEQKAAETRQKSSQVSPAIEEKDVMLIISALETILRMFRLPDFVVQLSERLLSTGTLQSCVKLYTFSHLLTNQNLNHEPVYAILAARLLVSLSTLHPVAEEMAVDGILSLVLTARITQALQRMPEGVSHLDQRNHGSLLYTLWSEGILPLALNLLHAVRAPIAAEISVFLNSFPNQLKIVTGAFQPKPNQYITLALAKEVSTLSLLNYILEDYRLAGASVGVDPSMISPLEGLDEHKKNLSENLREILRLNPTALKPKILPMNDKELTWHRGEELTKKIIFELQSAVSCLDREETIETDGEKSLT